MRVLSTLLILLAAATSALAAEPTGCDKFAWNIADAQRLLHLGELLNNRVRTAGDDVAAFEDLRPGQVLQLLVAIGGESA